MLQRGLIALTFLTLAPPALSQPVYQHRPNLDGHSITPEWTGDFSSIHQGGSIGTSAIRYGFEFSLALNNATRRLPIFQEPEEVDEESPEEEDTLEENG